MLSGEPLHSALLRHTPGDRIGREGRGGGGVEQPPAPSPQSYSYSSSAVQAEPGAPPCRAPQLPDILECHLLCQGVLPL